MVIILKRKILSAILSSLLGALIFSVPERFDPNLLLNLFYMNIMFVLTYGLISSLISDWLTNKIFTSTYAREIASFILHCLFGSVFKVLSLVPAILFFVIDRLLRKFKINWWTVILLLIIVVIIFVIGINLD